MKRLISTFIIIYTIVIAFQSQSYSNELPPIIDIHMHAFDKMIRTPDGTPLHVPRYPDKSIRKGSALVTRDEFVKGIMQKVAVYSMPAMYQIDDLVKCEGDPFENFVKFTAAWFNAMNEEGTWKVEEMRSEKDKLTFTVTECTNCTLGEAYDCPEIAKLGCDHDLAGYPVILDKVNAEFRRPHTIAKGDEYCDFSFYRKGTAPDTEHLNK